MKKNYYLWVILFIFLSTYNFYDSTELKLNFFSIKYIEIKGTKNSSQKDIEKKLNNIKGKNLFFLNRKNFQNLLDDIDFVETFEIKKIYPNKVRVEVIELEPIGVYINDQGKRYLLLKNNRIIKNYDNSFTNLPEVNGEGAIEKFSNFYKKIENSKFNLNLVKKYNYYATRRWDILLNDNKLIKLPPENYNESLEKFAEIYEKSEFNKFKIFDFRIKNELIMR